MRLGDGLNFVDDVFFSVLKNNSGFVVVSCDEQGQPQGDFPGENPCSASGFLGVYAQGSYQICHQISPCGEGAGCFPTYQECYDSLSVTFVSSSSSSSFLVFESSSSSSLFCGQDPTDDFRYIGNGCPEYEIPDCGSSVTTTYPDGTEVVVQGPRTYQVVMVGNSDYPDGVNPYGCMEIRCGKEIELLTPEDYNSTSLVFGVGLVDARLTGNSSSGSSGGGSSTSENKFCCGVEYSVNECGQLVMRCPDDPIPPADCSGGGGGDSGGGGGGGGGGGVSSSSIGSFESSSSSSS